MTQIDRDDSGHRGTTFLAHVFAVFTFAASIAAAVELVNVSARFFGDGGIFDSFYWLR
jgi:hypothetical protein